MEKKKILLINPNFQNRIKSIAQTTLGPPLGLAYIASSLIKRGFNAEIIDANAECLSQEKILEAVLHKNPDVVGMGAVTPTINDVGEICRKIKQKAPRIMTVVGGIHATLLPERTLRENPEIDFVIRGEGELSFPEFLAAKESAYPGISGLAYRDARNSRIVINDYERIKNLDDLPFPRRDILPLKSYHSFESDRFTTIMAMRGCPAGCIYCSVGKMFGSVIRYRSEGSVIAEIEECCSRFNINYFAFLDDTFTFKREWVEGLCRRLISSRLNSRIGWNCLTRADMLSEDLLRLMKNAGCRRVEIGIESGSEEVLAYLKKNLNQEQIRRAFALAKKVGLSTMGFVILNTPADNQDTYRQTKSLVFRADPDYLQVSFATPYPGTELYEDAKRRELIKHENWRDYIFLNRIILKNEKISEAEAMTQYNDLTRSFYLRAGYAWKLCRLVIKKNISIKRAFLSSISGLKQFLKRNNDETK